MISSHLTKPLLIGFSAHGMRKWGKIKNKNYWVRARARENILLFPPLIDNNLNFICYLLAIYCLIFSMSNRVGSNDCLYLCQQIIDHLYGTEAYCERQRVLYATGLHGVRPFLCNFANNREVTLARHKNKCDLFSATFCNLVRLRKQVV